MPHSRESSLRSHASSTMTGTSALKLGSSNGSSTQLHRRRRSKFITLPLLLIILPAYIFTLAVFPVLAITSIVSCAIVCE